MTASPSARHVGRPPSRMLAAMVASPLPELAVLLAVGGLLFFNAATLPYPPGYAGLYSLMAEEVARQPLPMPETIPFYGPGGVPFAYPPLGAYLAGFAVGVLRVPLFETLRWGPPVATLLAMAALYLFGRQLLGDRFKALVAVVVVGSAEITYVYHATASGMVRGPALLLALLGAAAAQRAFTADRHAGRWAIGGGLLLALAALTHLAYAVFLGIGLVLMALISARGRRLGDRARILGLILVAGAVFSAPWWAAVVGRYGFEVFSAARQTHGTFDFVTDAGGDPAAMVRELLKRYVNLGRVWWPSFLGGLTIVGLGYAIASGRWLPPAWMLGAIVVLGEEDRFVIVLAGLLAGDVLIDIARRVSPARPWRIAVGTETLGGLLFLGVTLTPLLAVGLRGIQWTAVALSDGLVDASTWVADNTPADSRYVYVGEDHDIGEWLPFLTRRTPAAAPWGAEWTGDHRRQIGLMADVEACARSQRLACVEGLLAGLEASVDLLVVHAGSEGLRSQLLASPRWAEAYRNPEYAVFLRQP